MTVKDYDFTIDYYATNKILGIYRLALIQWLIEQGVEASAAKRVTWMGWGNGKADYMLRLRNGRGRPFLDDNGFIACSDTLELDGVPPPVGSWAAKELGDRYWVEQMGGTS